MDKIIIAALTAVAVLAAGITGFLISLMLTGQTLYIYADPQPLIALIAAAAAGLVLLFSCAFKRMAGSR